MATNDGCKISRGLIPHDTIILALMIKGKGPKRWCILELMIWAKSKSEYDSVPNLDNTAYDKDT